MSLIKLNIVRGRNFPIMDTKSMLADAYCEIRFGPDFHFKTNIAKKTLNPVFNASFRIEVPTSRYAQDNILEIRVWDYDLVRSSDDLIGSIFIDPNVFDDIVDEMEGWLPLFDSLSGIRGELYIGIKVQILENLNPFRESSSLVTVYSHGSQQLLECQLAYELEQLQQQQQQQQQQRHSGNVHISSEPPMKRGTLDGTVEGVKKIRLSALDEHDTAKEDLPSLDQSTTSETSPSKHPILINDDNPLSPDTDATELTTTKYVIETLVEELLMDEDPEHEFLESLRASRVTNSRRMQLLFQLSGKVRRMMGKRAEEMGGDVICGYQENFDLEDDNIIVRAIGTICRRQQVIVPHSTGNFKTNMHTSPRLSPQIPPQTPQRKRFNSNAMAPPRTVGPHKTQLSAQQRHGMSPLVPTASSLPHESFNLVPTMHLAANTDTDSDDIYSNDTSSDVNTLDSPAANIAATADDVTLITMTDFEPNTVVSLGAAITVRSVKHVLDMKLSMLVDQRDEWWQEIREEVKSHAHAMNCTHVLGYNEHTVIYKDMCVLSATGTAAVLDNARYNVALRNDIQRQLPRRTVKHLLAICQNNCSIFHTRHSPDDESPFSAAQFTRCGVCGRHSVPEVMLSTLEIPAEAPIVPHSKRLLEARICKHKRRKQGESNTQIVSDMMPFIDYELHKQLLLKMKLHALNCCFNLQYDICVSDTKIVVVVTGTGCFSPALPAPGSLHFERSLAIYDHEDKKMFAVQNMLQELSAFNHGHGSTVTVNNSDASRNRMLVSSTLTAGSIDTVSEFAGSSSIGSHSYEHRRQFNSEMQAGFVVEIDDDFDEDQMAALLEPQLPDGLISFSNLQIPFAHEPLLRDYSSFMQTILMQKRFLVNVPPEHMNEHLRALFDNLYRELAFRCQAYFPCAVVGIRNDVKMTSDSELLICTRATVVMLPSTADSCDIHQVLLHKDVPEIEKLRRGNQLMLFDRLKIPLLFSMHAPRSPNQQHMNDILQKNKAGRSCSSSSGSIGSANNNNNNLTRGEDNGVSSGNEQLHSNTWQQTPRSNINSSPKKRNSMQFEMDEDDISLDQSTVGADSDSNSDTDSDTDSTSSDSSDDMIREKVEALLTRAQEDSALLSEFDTHWMENNRVLVTSAWEVPGCRVKSVFSRIGQHLVRESDVGYVDNGETFVQTLLSEALQIIKAHAAALGANCILNLSVDYHVHIFRKQSYSLLSISGDAAKIEYLSPTAISGTARIAQFSSPI